MWDGGNGGGGGEVEREGGGEVESEGEVGCAIEPGSEGRESESSSGSEFSAETE